MQELTTVFKALGDENRLKILWLLRPGTACVCDLADAVGISQPTLSHHLKVLREADLVEGRRDGTRVMHVLNREALARYRIDLDHLFATAGIADGTSATSRPAPKTMPAGQPPVSSG